MRNAEVERKTKETDIKLFIELDGTGTSELSTGIGFFDHMLTAFAAHSGFDLRLDATGDLEVDAHHTVEDVGIVLGQAFAKAIGDKKGIARYGNFAVPMDEALARCNVDVGGRAYLVFEARFAADRVGDFDTQLVQEFFRAFAHNANVTLHLGLLYGDNDHHKAEALFKAFAHALRLAVDVGGDGLLTTKGVI
ncbi:MAG: imidazoleglycerol-phosphate dehydratase HisB [Clostridiales Family XIII bacterium]|jgi:imidazoleglycerol-phosphate dehydratase|nr:imidazoleglycerol-phosphate dehydratase HisB [Clostridiales Family XIII bacterium]